MTNKELLASAQNLLASHRATCPNFRAVPRKDCAMCDGILKLASDILAVTPMEPLVFHKDAFALVWPPLGTDPDTRAEDLRKCTGAVEVTVREEHVPARPGEWRDAALRVDPK